MKLHPCSPKSVILRAKMMIEGGKKSKALPVRVFYEGTKLSRHPKTWIRINVDVLPHMQKHILKFIVWFH
jgi:hypothetical protein